jgi:hypothetical protein
MKYKDEKSPFRMEITKFRVENSKFRIETTYEVSDEIQVTDPSVNFFFRNASVAKIRNLKLLCTFFPCF